MRREGLVGRATERVRPATATDVAAAAQAIIDEATDDWNRRRAHDAEDRPDERR